MILPPPKPEKSWAWIVVVAPLVGVACLILGRVVGL